MDRKRMKIVYDVFLKNSLGTFLPECVKELSEKRPADPIEFIAHWLYKAQDSTLYVKAKQKFLEDCLGRAAEMKAQKDERIARVGNMQSTITNQKNGLRAARQAEIGHLHYLIDHARSEGGKVDPRWMERIQDLKQQMKDDRKKDKPLQITLCLPPIKTAGKKEVKKKKKKTKKEDLELPDLKSPTTLARGRSGSVAGVEKPLTLKTQAGMLKEKFEKKGDKMDLEDEESTANVYVTDSGKLVISSDLFGTIGVSGARTLPLGVTADNPDTWAERGWDCHVFTEHELYTRCDPESDQNINNWVKPMKLSEFIGLD